MRQQVLSSSANRRRRQAPRRIFAGRWQLRSRSVDRSASNTDAAAPLAALRAIGAGRCGRGCGGPPAAATRQERPSPGARRPSCRGPSGPPPTTESWADGRNGPLRCRAYANWYRRSYPRWCCASPRGPRCLSHAALAHVQKAYRLGLPRALARRRQLELTAVDPIAHAPSIFIETGRSSAPDWRFPRMGRWRSTCQPAAPATNTRPAQRCRIRISRSATPCGCHRQTWLSC